jgi:hypothetical protein
MIPFIVICVLALVLWLLLWSIVSFGKIGDLQITIRGLESDLNNQIIALDKLGREISGLRADLPPRAEPTPPSSVAPAVPASAAAAVPLPPIVPEFRWWPRPRQPRRRW